MAAPRRVNVVPLVVTTTIPRATASVSMAVGSVAPLMGAVGRLTAAHELDAGPRANAAVRPQPPTRPVPTPRLSRVRCSPPACPSAQSLPTPLSASAPPRNRRRTLDQRLQVLTSLVASPILRAG